jgi:hypothetical protein
VRRTRTTLASVCALSALAALGAASAGASISETGRESDRIRVAPASLFLEPMSAEEVNRLTELGPVPEGVPPERLEVAWQTKWGLQDIGVVPDALEAASLRYPGADGGLTYNPSTLTYTQWVVKAAAGEDG